MADFQTTTTSRSRKARTCPECWTEIEIGQKYRREFGRYDGDVYSAIMCEPCGTFMDRYVASMQCASILNADEVVLTFGDIINEAAEYIEHKPRRGDGLPETRDTILALFDDFDKGEREYRRKEAAQRKEAALQQGRRAAEMVRLSYGQGRLSRGPSA